MNELRKIQIALLGLSGVFKAEFDFLTYPDYDIKMIYFIQLVSRWLNKNYKYGISNNDAIIHSMEMVIHLLNSGNKAPSFPNSIPAGECILDDHQEEVVTKSDRDIFLNFLGFFKDIVE